MFIGSHGYQHLWLGLQTPDVQKREMERSDAFLDEVGVRSDRRAIAYPYGSYNDGLIQLLTGKGYCLGLTSEQGDAVCTKENAFVLLRRDTNEFAKA
jgi:peptidoglycan/xylan/chitin deacetylase (PgdA/CDA1 family)